MQAEMWERNGTDSSQSLPSEVQVVAESLETANNVTPSGR